MNNEPPNIYEFDEFRLDVAKRLLTKSGGKPIALTSRVFDTLLYLVRNGGKVIEKDELMREIWIDSVVEENNLTQNISALRRVFREKPGEQLFIVTVPGHGYRFVPEVRPLAGLPSPDALGTEAGAGADPDPSETNPSFVNRSRLVTVAVVFLVAMAGIGTYLWKSASSTTESRISTLAILPFKPLVTENRNAPLELGLADSLIAELSDGEIIVRPLSSTRSFTSVEQDALAVGRELEVESVLDGTIQNWGDRIRVSAKLLRTSDGKQLWAEQFDEKFTDIFAVQDKISERVASALKIRLGNHERKHATESAEAYQAYMVGLYHVNKLSPSDIRTGIGYFQQAIDIDPRYALAYTGIAKAYGVLAISGDMPPAEAIPLAKAAARTGIELDDTLGEAHDSICMAIFWHDWDWPAAERECRRAVEINPNNADTRDHLAIILSNTGRHAEALAESKRSRELNPLSLANRALEGQYLLHAGQIDEALESLRKTSEMEPNFWMPHMFAASAYIDRGMYAEALGESQKELELSGRNLYPFGAYALAKLGRRDEARTQLKGLLAQAAEKFVPPYNIALLYNALDQRGSALEWLQKGYEQRDANMTFLKVESKWNNLRSDPEFVDLMRRMNF